MANQEKHRRVRFQSEQYPPDGRIMRFSTLHLLGYRVRIAQPTFESRVLEDRILARQAIGFANHLCALHDGVRGCEANIGALFDAAGAGS